MRTRKLFVTSVLALVLLFSVQGFAQDRQVDWERFSINLEVALRSAHPGLQQSAMQQVIKYADKLTLDDGIYRIGRIFCYGTDVQERRLALVALSKINTLKSMAYVYSGMTTEDNDAVKKQSCCIIQEYCMANIGISEDDVKVAALEL